MMSYSNLFQRILAAASAALLVLGCSSAALMQTTATPVSVAPVAETASNRPGASPTAVRPTKTPTAVPAGDASGSAAGPRPGHWTGDHGISFTVTENGTISEFRIALGDCVITSGEELSVAADDKIGTFVLNPERVFQGSDASSGSDFSAEGIFQSETAVSGTYFVQICGGMLFFNAANTRWSGEWQSP